MLFQGLRQQYTTARGSRRLNQRSDYDLHGPNKDDAVPALRWGGRKKKQCLFVSYFSSSQAFRKRSVDVTSLFADILFAAGCTEGLLFFEFANHPNIYMRNHNCTAWEGKHPRLGCKIAALLASVIIPKLLSPSPSLALCVCVWQDRLLNPRAFAA